MPELKISINEASGLVAMWLRANPDKHLNRSAAAVLLQIAIGAVDPQLQPGVTAGLLTMFNDGEFGRCWRAGPRLAHWVADPVRGQTALGKTAPPARDPRRKNQHLPALDINKLPTVTGPAPIGRLAAKGTTKHDALFDSLTADNLGKTGIPKAYMGALMKAAQTYLMQRPAIKAASVLLVRSVSDTHCGVWRVAKGLPAAAESAPRKRAA